MNINLMILIFMSLLIGCSKAPKTSAKFNLKSLSNLGTSVNLISENGIVIFGVSDNGHRFAKVMNTSDEFNYELDNGVWTFKAVAWDAGDPTAPVDDGTNPDTKFMGTPSCALTTVSLTGADATIDLPLKNVDCELAEFSDGKAMDDGLLKKFYTLTDIYSCDESTGDGSTVTPGTKCLNDFADFITSGGEDSRLNRGYHSFII